MIELDEPELIAPRKRRVTQAAEAMGIDSWLLTTSQAVRTVTGAWSDDVDLFGEWASPIVAVGATVLDRARPPSDPRLIDDVVDLLPTRGTIAVDRLGPLAQDRLTQLRPDLVIQDAALLLGAAKVPRDQIEVDVLVEAHRRTEAVLASMAHLVVPGVSERDLTAEFTVRAAESGLDRMHLDTVFGVLPAHHSDAPWARGLWETRSPYRELTTDRVLAEGDHVAFDAGVGYSGYTADVGWTLLASHDGPSPEEVSLATEWDDVARRVIDAAKPGVSASVLRAAALEGWNPDLPPPWPYPLYVAHGVGTELAEPPFAGADFAPEDEEAMVLVEGNVLMIEPYIWREGVGGYRAEYCVVVGSSGTDIASSLPYGQWPEP
ncbi:MAG: M24 family metallopeptidase [Acidimicrobiales bacterium]